MRRYKTDRLTGMGRRRFLRNLTGLGVSGVALEHMSKEALADVTDDPQEEVPRLSRLRHTNHDEVVAGTAPPEYEPVYYTISREKWAVVETAHDAAEKMDRLLSRLDSSGLLSAGVRTFTKDQRKQKGVHVRYHVQVNEDGEAVRTPDVSFEELKGNLPATVAGTAGEGEHAVTIDDIPVELSRSEFNNLDHNDPSGGASDNYYYDYVYRPIPAGAMVIDDNTGELGTIATPAYDYDLDEYVLTTVAHLTDVESGHSIEQPCCSYYVGKSDKGSFSWWDFDAATIDINTADHGSYDVEYALADDDGNYSLTPIYGTLVWDTIKDNEGNTSYNMQWQGAASGHHSDNYIVETNTDHYFWLDDPGTGGDSGGPMYHVEFSGHDGRAYIGGIVGQRDDGDGDGDDDVAGTWIGDVENKFNINV